MKKIILKTNRVNKSESLRLSYALTEFLSLDDKSVMWIDGDYVDKITVIDVNPDLYKEEHQKNLLTRKKKNYIDGQPIEKGTILIIYGKKIVFEKYDEKYFIIDNRGYPYSYFDRVATDDEIKKINDVDKDKNYYCKKRYDKSLWKKILDFFSK